MELKLPSETHRKLTAENCIDELLRRLPFLESDYRFARDMRSEVFGVFADWMIAEVLAQGISAWVVVAVGYIDELAKVAESDAENFLYTCLFEVLADEPRVARLVQARLSDPAKSMLGEAIRCSDRARVNASHAGAGGIQLA